MQIKAKFLFLIGYEWYMSTENAPTTSFVTPDGTHRKFPLGKTSGSELELAKRNFRMLSLTMPHPSGPVTNSRISRKINWWVKSSSLFMSWSAKPHLHVLQIFLKWKHLNSSYNENAYWTTASTKETRTKANTKTTKLHVEPVPCLTASS